MEPTDDQDAEMSPEAEEFLQTVAEEIRSVVTSYRDVFGRAGTIGEPLALAVQGLHDQPKPIADDWVSRIIGSEVKHDELVACLSNTAQEWRTALQKELQDFQQVMEKAGPLIKKALEGAGRLGAAGWTLSMDMAIPEVLEIEELAVSQLDAHFLRHYADMENLELTNLERRLFERSELGEFRTLLTQCFNAYRRGDFAITIAPLVTVFERALRILWPSEQFYSTKILKLIEEQYANVKRDAPDSIELYAWMSLVAFVNWLYHDYKSAQANDARMFRHGIQHGTQAPPNLQVESLRLFHALDTVVALFPTAETATD